MNMTQLTCLLTLMYMAAGFPACLAVGCRSHTLRLPPVCAQALPSLNVSVKCSNIDFALERPICKLLSAQDIVGLKSTATISGLAESFRQCGSPDCLYPGTCAPVSLDVYHCAYATGTAIPGLSITSASYSFGDGGPWVITTVSQVDTMACPFTGYRSIATCLSEMVYDTSHSEIYALTCPQLFSMNDVIFEECLHRCCGGGQTCNAINYYPSTRACAGKRCGVSLSGRTGVKNNTRYVHMSYLLP